MQLLFYRKYPFQVRIQNQAQQFFAELGFFSPLNPETGMSANLPEIDQTFAKFIQIHSEFESFEKLVECLQKFFFQNIKDSELQKIQIRRLDGLSIHWQKGVYSYSELFVFRNLFQVEAASFDLMQIQRIKKLVSFELTESAPQLMQYLSSQTGILWARVTDPSNDLSYLHTQNL